MADGHRIALSDSSEEAAHRPERRTLVCFSADATTEEALRTGFADWAGQDVEYRRANADRATAALRTMPTPWTLVVDVAGHPQPLVALEDLSQAVEPDVRVLVVGDRQDVGFYRQLTHGLGVADYLYKPLTAAMVAEHFGPVVARKRHVAGPVRGGRLLTVTGARGGVGASTLAANLGWYMASVAQRHTVVLDADLHRGTQALLLGIQAVSGLRNAIERPERVDELFVERVASTAATRLHLLAAEEPLASPLAYVLGSAERLVSMLRRRYNFIVADAPYAAEGLGRELPALAQQRILVMVPTLACVRDTLRLLQLETGLGPANRPLVVLNRAGCKGGLSTARVTDALKQQPDLIVPDVPRQVEAAATLGELAAGGRGAFRAAVAQLAHLAGGIARDDARRSGLLSRFRR